MAQIVGAEHYERSLDLDDLLDFLPEMVRLQDEPIADPVCVPVYYLSKLARDQGVIVCQVGEGSDELFCGYPFWRTALRFSVQSTCSAPACSRPGMGILQRAGKEYSLLYEWLRRSTEEAAHLLGGSRSFHRQPQAAASITTTASPVQRSYVLGDDTPHSSRALRVSPGQSALNWMSYLDLNLRLPELLLMRVDNMSMGVSLEGRLPFLDYRFVELAMSIPSAMKTATARSSTS